jgi:pimeloyl-ACP methyl ester carboxylesterase
MKHRFLIVLLFLSTHFFAQEKHTKFEEVTSFYPNNELMQRRDIEWGKFTVPENWENPQGKKIQIAIAKLKNTSNKSNAEAMVMVEGGPGESSTESIWIWLNNPLRKNYDIILVDARGTGASQPRLCPNLGTEFFKILAKNQSPEEDEKQKTDAAMQCRRNLIANNIDISQYHSKAIGQDLHALKEHFKYTQWNVYGVSYGTYVAQEYAKEYPNDVRALILDSPIAELDKYYTQNTSNYIRSLDKLFSICDNSPECKATYPALEATYYATIEKLKQNPITVPVDKTIIPSGEFTYNAEDFKVAIHQALYQYKLIEVLPMLIYQFHDGNVDALSALVTAFSGALNLDYGLYYCVTCNETIPNNSFGAYQQDVSKQKSLQEGLSFYRSDFLVCDQWNAGQQLMEQSVDSIPKVINIPTLVYSGGFDPITPSTNAIKLVKELPNAQWIEGKAFGHAIGFTPIGFQTTNTFLQNPTAKINNDFERFQTGFVKGVHINGGVANMGNSIQNLDLIFMSPLAISILIALFAIFAYLFSFRKKEKSHKLFTLLKILLIVSSILAIFIIAGLIIAMQDISAQNFYVLVFGLPEKYAYLFSLILPFIICIAITTILFFAGIKTMKDRSITFTVVFANILIAIYLFHWGFI